MENKNLKIFLDNVKNNVITTILGNAATGKSILVSVICEYFLLKNHPCIVLNSNMDDTIIERIEKSYLLSKKNFSLQSRVVSTLDETIEIVKTIKDTLIVIDDLGSMRSLLTPNGNIGEASQKMNAFFRQLRQIGMENNNTIIIISHMYQSFIPNSSQAVSIPYSSSGTYTSDTIGICYKDKKDGILKFHIEKSRTGDLIQSTPILNLSSLIKSIIRKEKIAKLLSNNLEN